MKTDIKNIDPALGLIGEFSKLTKGTVAHIDKMRKDAILSDGIVPAKFKALSAVLWSISARCEPCIKYYVGQALRHGASEAELGEFLAISSVMGGCVGEMWALKAYKTFKEIQSGDLTPSQESCCDT